MVKTLTIENFDEIIGQCGTVVVDFWATWCGPCRGFSPIIEAFAEENPDVVVGKVNIDEEEALTDRCRIMRVPTLVLFKDGKEVKRTTGAMKKEEIENFISE